MSGIATATRKMVDACEGAHARVLETRKTVPGLRLLDKWAVLIGGGVNHRMGLYDMIMIKDNHIAAAGGLRQAVAKGHAYAQAAGRRIEIEVEARTLEEVGQVVECLSGGTYPLLTRVMLDNMAKPLASAEGERLAAGSACMHCLCLQPSCSALFHGRHVHVGHIQDTI
jgi:nicotinate-nucleotide pyrophosphorylase (carboxylating)